MAELSTYFHKITTKTEATSEMKTKVNNIEEKLDEKANKAPLPFSIDSALCIWLSRDALARFIQAPNTVRDGKYEIALFRYMVND